MPNLTPAMRQYMEVKDAHPDAIIFFRMGDFYEMFFDDAKVAARELGIALTARDKEKKIPMCGIPYHAAATYMAKLVRAGHKVAVCDQVEDPRAAKGIVKREVTRVVTPGVAFEDEILDPGSNNFVAAASMGSAAFGLSYMDASTGEFRTTELGSPRELFDEIQRIRPLELVVRDSDAERYPAYLNIRKITTAPDFDFTQQAATERLCAQFGLHSLDGLGCAGMRAGVQAAGALLAYIGETQKGSVRHLKRLSPYHTHEYLVIDSQTRRNLEITENIRDGGRTGTLLALLDHTGTAIGARRLRSWLLNPLKDVHDINARLDAVEELLEGRSIRGELSELFDGVYDLERLATRVSLSSAGPRDLVCLKDSLTRVPAIGEVIRGLASPLVEGLASRLDGVAEAASLIAEAIVDDPPVYVRDGGVIREGYSADLDELRSIGSGGKDRIAGIETTERARTGINTLKVGYNKVFGYYIEVTKANLANVPDDYIRKQTLVGAERFITPALKEWEEKILGAEEKAREIEGELYRGVLSVVAAHTARIQNDADVISDLDALSSLAAAAEARDYTRPDVHDGLGLFIEEGRHPVIEATLSEDFVPNDIAIDPGSEQLIVLTGPNMAGKSTYLRQNALIVLMAQIGSFVPAARADLGVTDRIFTRIGAADDISRGQSTFMVEMNETANILNNATARSLIILDEIGRGTSTFDGLSIAWAVVEYLHDTPGLAGKTRTLFATHYHELTELSLTKERVKNYNMAVKQWEGKVIFLRKVVPGGCSSSYGIQVARLAGLPGRVIERAGEILHNLEKGELTSAGVPRIAVKAGPSGKDGATAPDPPAQLNLLGGKDPVAEELRGTDINGITPVEALNLLCRLKEMVED